MATFALPQPAWRRWLALPVLSLAIGMVGIDVSIVSVANSTIGRDLHYIPTATGSKDVAERSHAASGWGRQATGSVVVKRKDAGECFGSDGRQLDNRRIHAVLQAR